MKGWLMVLLVLAAGTLIVEARDQILSTEANVMGEMELVSSERYEDPFNQVAVDVVFTPPEGPKLRVPAFWAGP